ncbi:MAG TPA: di-heme-cytochrome C peroxidase [Vicinamibacteria bacterium]|nr:di-heme-cytochrome C peroxidase [Vicinamibacteria bacterium]
MKRLLRWLLRLATALVVVAIAVALMLIHRPARHVPSVPEIQAHAYLDQGWGTAREAPLRQAYYDTPQGTSLKSLRYDWLVHLEMPWGTRRLADPAHLRSYGFIVDPEPTAANPDQLPVGFARRFDPELGEAVLDITCAACHTGQLVVDRAGKRTAVRIDGGPASHAFTTTRLGHFVPTLTASLASTYLNPFKFRRFARRVLGASAYDRGWKRLHEDLGDVLGAFLQQGWKEQTRHLYPVEEGFGRTDALARIGNTVFADELDGANDAIGNAPVSYPYLWNIWKFDWVQYNASVSQPMARNMGESFGVGARLHLLDRYGRPLPQAERFRTSVLVENLHRIETTLQRLQPPQWPEDILGPVDRVKAERGRALFEQHCRHCHGPFDLPAAVKAYEDPLRADGDPLWKMTIVPIAEVGTDPTAAMNFSFRTVDLTRTGLASEEVMAAAQPMLAEARRRLALLDARVAEAVAGKDPQAESLTKAAGYEKDRVERAGHAIAGVRMDKVPLGLALSFLGQIARERYYADRGFTPEQSACLDGFGSLDLPEIVPAYKSRPLAGVWATGPFLHNGSVPTLYQMLSPHDERPARFFVSPGSFDPVDVGVDVKARGDGFWLDTTLPGNANVGHEFRAGYVHGKTDADDPQYGVIGPALSPDDRRAIVEYLKIHQDPPTPPDRVPPDCGIH